MRERESKGRTLIAALALAAFLVLPAGMWAVTICDGSDIGCGRKEVSTAKSLESGNSAGAVEPSYRIPIGTIIVWHSDKMPEDADKWLECDGQEVKQSQYPLLYALMHHTPNYMNRFLRSGGSGDVGKTAEDTIKSHTSIVPQHDHSFSVTTKGSVNVLQEDGYMDVYSPAPIANDESSSESQPNPAESKMDKTFMSAYLCDDSTTNYYGIAYYAHCSESKYDITVQRALASAETGNNAIKSYQCTDARDTRYTVENDPACSLTSSSIKYTADYQTGKSFCNATVSVSNVKNLCKISDIIHLKYENMTGALKATKGLSKVEYDVFSRYQNLENGTSIYMSAYLCDASTTNYYGIAYYAHCSESKHDITVQRAHASAETGNNAIKSYQCTDARDTRYTVENDPSCSLTSSSIKYTADYQTGKSFCNATVSVSNVKNLCKISDIIKLKYEEVTGALKASGGMSKVTYQNVSYAKSSSVSANTIKVPRLKAKDTAIDGETIQGRTDMAPQLRATYAGGTETAPKHIYVRYLIRAKN